MSELNTVATRPRKGGRPRRQCDHAPKFDTEGRCVECRNHRLRTRYKNSEVTRARIKIATKTFRRDNPKMRMLWSASQRARKGRYPCTISEADIVIPGICPLLGIWLTRGVGKPSDNSPELDKIIPELGYVPGNVWVISRRANTLKNNATLSELEMLVEGLRRALA